MWYFHSILTRCFIILLVVTLLEMLSTGTGAVLVLYWCCTGAVPWRSVSCGTWPAGLCISYPFLYFLCVYTCNNTRCNLVMHVYEHRMYMNTDSSLDVWKHKLVLRKSLVKKHTFQMFDRLLERFIVHGTVSLLHLCYSC